MEGSGGLFLCQVDRKRRREESAPKKLRTSMVVATDNKVEEEEDGGEMDYFERFPDDLVVSILCKLSSSAASPVDFISALLACKRFNVLGRHQTVLSKASARALAVRAKNWSESSHRFLKLCVDAGNLEAHYILGMIRFYCQRNRGGGAALMAKAAIKSHAQSLYSLAVIQFNGSGGAKSDKDLRAGVALCARAAFLGHIDALRELGHCLQDGYGVRRNVPEGRRFLIQANARELAAALPATAAASWPALYELHRQTISEGAVRPPATGPCPLLSDYGWSLPALEPHPANRFLTEWFAEREPLQEGLRLCSHGGCGRPETRRHEFRRCSVCGTVNYCSRACQALDWKMAHKAKCAPLDHWLLDAIDAPAAGGVAGGAGTV